MDGFTNIGRFVMTQINEFECQSCGEHTEFEAMPHVPAFPCQFCGNIDWVIYAINDHIIYPDRS